MRLIRAEGGPAVRCAMHGRTSRAFTLVETIVSSALIGILLLTMGSAILLSTHALPSDQHAGKGRLAAAAALEQLADDLAHVLFITDRSPTAVTLIVPDRTGDGRSERIRYEWAGEPGEPLTRRFNDSPAHLLLDRVHAFELTFHLTTRERSYPSPVRESDEQLIAAYAPLDLLGLIDDGYAVTATDWAAQSIDTSLPEDTLWWQPTGAAFKARDHSDSGGIVHVDLMRVAGDDDPAFTALAHGAVDASDLGTLLSPYEWAAVTFDTAERIRPGQPLALRFRNDGGDESPARIGYTTGSGRRSTTDAGQHWNRHALQAHIYRLWGVVTRQGPPQTAAFERFYAVAVTLSSADEPDSPLRMQTHLRNEPGRLDDAWLLDFHQHPQSLDLMAKRIADWDTASGQLLPFDEQGSATWFADSELQTRPLHDFDTLTRVDLRLRHHGPGEQGAVFQLFADRSSGNAAELRVAITQQDDGSQTLTLHNPGNAEPLLIEATNLSAEFIDVALLIDPAYATIHLEIDGRSHGTFPYARRSVTAGERYAAIFGDAGQAEFDIVRIRVSP